MLKFFKMLVPSGEHKQVEAIEMWVVSWEKRFGQYSGDTRKCFQAFANKEDAIHLKKALDDAHKLIGNTSGTYVLIESQKAGL